MLSTRTENESIKMTDSEMDLGLVFALSWPVLGLGVGHGLALDLVLGLY